MASTLVKLVGFPATLIHGDTMVLDRWLWLQKRLQNRGAATKLLDVGCGTGAFTIGAARLGYEALGIDYKRELMNKAAERAVLCRANSATFRTIDVRTLGEYSEFKEQFDVVICTENIEHILNDKKLMQDMAYCLKLGGKLFLTAPNYSSRAITLNDNGPFSEVEDGSHVRRGYTAEGLQELCDASGLVVNQVTYCSGLVSQKLTFVLRTLGIINYLLAWSLILPFRILPPILDPILTPLLGWPGFSIALEAQKPVINR